jgi:hypothetical protein
LYLFHIHVRGATGDFIPIQDYRGIPRGRLATTGGLQEQPFKVLLAVFQRDDINPAIIGP